MKSRSTTGTAITTTEGADAARHTGKEEGAVTGSIRGRALFRGVRERVAPPLAALLGLEPEGLVHDPRLLGHVCLGLPFRRAGTLGA